MDLFEYSKNKEAEKKEEKPQTATETVLSVSEITREIKYLINSFSNSKGTFWIKGELSGYKGVHQNGHMYFKLKDENAVIDAAFFRGSHQKSKIKLSEGLCILARGRLDVFEKRGGYQLIIEEVKEEGTGDLYRKFEQLKKKLEEEGLFAQEHKKPLPKFPSTIGVITSASGAVIRDIIHVIRNRYPMVKVLLFPVKVQGEGSADEIVEALASANQSPASIDVLIVGRGGGSIEDLWSFNEEIVARAIFASKIPVVSAVGHQTDFTIADFVADVRAATPSQAAEMVVPNLVDLRGSIIQIIRHIVREISSKKNIQKEKLQRFLKAPVLVNPRNLVYQKAQRFDFAFETFSALVRRYKQDKRSEFEVLFDRFGLFLQEGLKRDRMRLEKAQSNLQLVSPTAVMSRGFSIVEKKSREIVRDSGQVEVKEEITVRLHKGSLECQVTKR